jgi:DNA-binding transcriptional MerR regulator
MEINKENNLPEKLYYSIGEVAEMLGVNTSLLRYWEKEFKTLRPKKTSSGNRLFTAKDIEKLKYLYFLIKVQGHTLEGAKKLFKAKEFEENKDFNTLRTLEKLRSFLIELKNEL